MANYISYVKLTENVLSEMAVEKSWKGSGQQGDPLIIDNSEDLSQNLKIMKSNLIIALKNCAINALLIEESKHISIESCEFNRLHILKSSSISVKNTAVSITFSLERDTSKINVEDSKIDSLTLSSSHENTFRNCVINRITSGFSRGNIFEHNHIPELAQYELIKDGFTKVYKSLILFALAVLMFGFQFLLQVVDFILWIQIIIGIFGLTYYGIYVFKENRKNNKYPPNKII